MEGMVHTFLSYLHQFSSRKEYPQLIDELIGKLTEEREIHKKMQANWEAMEKQAARPLPEVVQEMCNNKGIR